MRYIKKPKYKLKKDKISIKEDKDLTAQELYQERLRDKKRIARRK